MNGLGAGDWDYSKPYILNAMLENIGQQFVHVVSTSAQFKSSPVRLQVPTYSILQSIFKAKMPGCGRGFGI